MGERMKLIGSFEGMDMSGKGRRVWIFRHHYNQYVMVDWRSQRHSAHRSHCDLVAVGNEVESELGLQNMVWKPLPKWGSAAPNITESTIVRQLGSHT